MLSGFLRLTTIIKQNLTSGWRSQTLQFDPCYLGVCPTTEYHSIQGSRCVFIACFVWDTGLSSFSVGSGCFHGRQLCVGRIRQAEGARRPKQVYGAPSPLLQLLLAFLSVISSAGWVSLSHSSPSKSDHLLGKRLTNPDCEEPGVQLRDPKTKLQWDPYAEWANPETPGSSRERSLWVPFLKKPGFIHGRDGLSFARDLWVESRILAKASGNRDPELRVRSFIVGTTCALA